MASREVDDKELKARKARAIEWRNFMKNNLFTEKSLAETIGVSRRTVQMVKGGLVSPHEGTLKSFASLKEKYDKEAKRRKS